MRRLIRKILPNLATIVLAASGVHAQSASQDPAAQAPRFLLLQEASGAPVPVDPQQAQALLRRISLDLPEATLGEALGVISSRSGLRLMYSTTVAPLDRQVRLQAENVTVGAALTQVLQGTGIDVMLTGQDEAVLVRQEAPRAPTQPKSGAITGRVVERGTETPVVSAQVLVDGKSWALTNGEGRYEIRGVAPGRRTVVVTSIGYVTDTSVVVVPEGGRITHDVALEVSPTKLADLVVTATGRQRRVELGHDVTIIRVDSIMQHEPVTSVTDLLEGRVPGLVVQRTTGAPGDPARIRIRGVSSPLQSNDPIIVVDGVRVYSGLSDERAENLVSSGVVRYNTPSPLDYIDPHTIETIQVVKGPSAATLYGQDAANGVIVITTKKGQPGPARWTVSAEYGQTAIPGKYPELMLRFGRDILYGSRVFCPINNWVGGGWPSNLSNSATACVPESVESFQILNDPELTVLDQGERSAVNLGVSGGSSSITYNLQGTYRDETGLVKLPEYEVERYRSVKGTTPPEWMRRPQRYRQWSAAARVSAQLNAKTQASVSANLSHLDQQRSALENQLGTLMTTYLDRETGTYYRVNKGNLNNLGGVLEVAEDVMTGYAQRATATATQLTSGINVNWQATSWLTLTSDLGLNIVQRSDEIFLPAGTPGWRWNDSHIRVGKGTSVVSTARIRGHTQIPLAGGFQLTLNAGADYTGTTTEDLKVFGTRLPEGAESVNAAEDKAVEELRSDQATYGWFIEPGISHQRLWVSGGLRLDGGSSFGPRKKLPAFPKVSISYLISDEPFFPERLRSVVGSLRLRAAYGHAGRQPQPTDHLRLYGLRMPRWVDGRYVDAYLLEEIGNTELKPERSRELEGGFEADLLDDRLMVSFTAYRKTTEDALLRVPVAPSVYGSGVSMWRNIGVVRNSGLEATVAVEPVRSEAVTWRSQIDISRNRNIVVELGPGVEPFYTSYNGISTITSGIRVVPGFPLGGRWVRPVLGYADANGNGILEPQEIAYGDTLVYVGGTLPDYTAALHNTVSLFRGRLSISATFHYENGMTQRNQLGKDLATFSRAWNDPSAPIAEQLRVFDQTEFTWIQTTNSLRFNALSVTYQVPAAIAARVGARGLSISLQGANLGLWTNYRGLDPNVNARVAGNDVTDSGILPQPRSWQLRMNASF